MKITRVLVGFSRCLKGFGLLVNCCLWRFSWVDGIIDDSYEDLKVVLVVKLLRLACNIGSLEEMTVVVLAHGVAWCMERKL